MTEEDNYRGIDWPLGNDSDCDTCGFSWNEAEFDPDWHGPNEWMFSYRVGCYGGDSVSCFDENREEKLDEMFKYLKGYPGWPGRLTFTVRKMIEDCDRERV